MYYLKEINTLVMKNNVHKNKYSPRLLSLNKRNSRNAFHTANSSARNTLADSSLNTNSIALPTTRTFRSITRPVVKPTKVVVVKRKKRQTLETGKTEVVTAKHSVPPPPANPPRQPCHKVEPFCFTSPATREASRAAPVHGAGDSSAV